MLYRILLMAWACLLLPACGGGGSDSPTPTPSPSPTGPAPAQVEISGSLSYDYVPHNSNGSLNYDSIEPRAIRGATVQLLNGTAQVVDSTTSDNEGGYSLSASINTNYRVRVLAELRRNAFPGWDVQVVDNTADGALYVLDGSLASSGSQDSERDLHAPSGWVGNSYSAERAAGPFAILDSIYEMLLAFEEAGLDENLPSTRVNWSSENRAVTGDLADGDIGTSFFNTGTRAIYILGHANNDTDEYDRSVVQHEFGHYLENVLARSESIGGSHEFGRKIDMRLAYSEGLANALTGLVSGTGYYEDSGGTGQAFGFRFDLETVSSVNAGWFSERSVSALVFDIADPANDDALDLGLAGLYEAMSSNTFTASPALASIYLLLHSVSETLGTADQQSLASMAASQEIFGEGIWGEGETNNGSVSGVLPIYESASLGATVNLCSNDAEGQYNGLDARRFARLGIPANDSYRITLQATEQGTGDSDPDLVIWRDGSIVRRADSSALNRESTTIELAADDYVLEVYDFDNIQGSGGIACFDVSVEAL